MQKILAVCLSLAISVPLYAVTPAAPTKVTVKQGELARVEVDIPDGGLAYSATATDAELFLDELVSKAGKLRLVIQGKKDGTYYIAFVNGKDIAFTRIVVGSGEQKQDDDTKPPVPSPFSGKLKAYIITESADKNVNYSRIFATKAVTDYWTSHQFILPVIADPDVKDAATGKLAIDTPSSKLRPYLLQAKGKSDQMYLVDVSTGKVLYEGNAPTTADALLGIVTSLK